MKSQADQPEVQSTRGKDSFRLMTWFHLMDKAQVKQRLYCKTWARSRRMQIMCIQVFPTDGIYCGGAYSVICFNCVHHEFVE